MKKLHIIIAKYIVYEYNIFIKIILNHYVFHSFTKIIYFQKKI
jgi:hypothetical protein